MWRLANSVGVGGAVKGGAKSKQIWGVRQGGGAQAVTSRATKTEKRSGKKEFRTISFVLPNRLIINGILEQIKIQ